MAVGLVPDAGQPAPAWKRGGPVAIRPSGPVFFDPNTQNRIAAVLMKAAAELGVPIGWGGRFLGYKDMDRSHFELARP